MAPLDRKLNEKSDEKFNYADYLTWPDDERWEIIERSDRETIAL